MKTDGRTLDHKTLEYVRLTACRRVRQGERPSEVMKSLGLCRTTIYLWLRAYREGGEKSILSKKSVGPKEHLSPNQSRELRNLIYKKDPRDLGYQEGLWSRRIISEVIEDRFKVRLTLAGITKVLRRLKITPQKPLRRAYERNPELIKEWKSKTLPKICKRAKKHNALILYLDEAGIQSDPVLGRTWGKKGITPVVRTSGQRQKINAISAVAPSGEFKYLLYQNRFNASFFIEVLKEFTRGMKRACYFIVDNHPSHRAKVVSDFIKSTKGAIELYFLPPYSPDLNPDEFVWNQIKTHGISKKPLKGNESLEDRVRSDLEAIKKNKKLIRSFFRAKSVEYPSYL
jgi:transposase